MSEVSVNRTAAGGYCLIIDRTRVAGGKPEFSSDNCFYWWETAATIGVVDDFVAEVESLKVANERLRKSIDETCAGWAEAYETLEAENEKLKQLAHDIWHELDAATQYDAGGGRGIVFELANSMRDLGIEVNE